MATTADVVVVGAGVIGCSVAWEPARSDLDVVVLRGLGRPPLEHEERRLGRY